MISTLPCIHHSSAPRMMSLRLTWAVAATAAIAATLIDLTSMGKAFGCLLAQK